VCARALRSWILVMHFAHGWDDLVALVAIC
jgi:hypothetical protein